MIEKREETVIGRNSLPPQDDDDEEEEKDPEPIEVDEQKIIESTKQGMCPDGTAYKP